ncbi:MAG: hypothetical protein QM569_07410, partial [Acidovorax sp.]|uniref:hypothetical protein n=1 Tax=Acidovorax sp. TaxID=1872122 RepID=UPI0039E39230
MKTPLTACMRAWLRGALGLLVVLMATWGTPGTARADVLDLVGKLGPVVNPYIVPVKLEWIGPVVSALSSPACQNLGSDVGAAQCADAVLSTDAANELAGADAKMIQAVLAVYLDLRSGDWAGLFEDLFRMATSGSPLDVACLAISVVASGFPVCEVFKLLYDVGAALVGAAGEAASALEDWGEKFIQGDHMSWGQYFSERWVPHVERVARGIATGSEPNAWDAVLAGAGGVYNKCFEYFDSHRVSGKNANGVCSDMRDGTAKHIGEFQGRGFTQLVQWRQQEYLLPQAARNAVDVQVKAYDTPANRQYPPPPPELAAYLPPEAVQGLPASDIQRAVRAVYGLNLNDGTVGVDAWPPQSIGGLAKALMRTRAPNASSSSQAAAQAIAETEGVVGLPSRIKERIDALRKERWDQLLYQAKVAALPYGKRDELRARCAAHPNPLACRQQVDNGDLACKAKVDAMPKPNALGGPGAVSGPLQARAQATEECYAQLEQAVFGAKTLQPSALQPGATPGVNPALANAGAQPPQRLGMQALPGIGGVGQGPRGPFQGQAPAAAPTPAATAPAAAAPAVPARVSPQVAAQPARA